MQNCGTDNEIVSTMRLLREFKPALVFLGKFLALYLIGNILYGLYVESYGDRPDAITSTVTSQTSAVLDVLGYQSSYQDVATQPKVALMDAGTIVLYVFEGCNGINVMIVFVAFLFAFGGRLKRFLIFLPIGLLVIHLFNLVRVAFLFYLAQTNSTQFYYYHKYLFTATLYAVVFILWYFWVAQFNEDRRIKIPT